MDRSIRIFLCGDVMTGRGIDQVLPHPCDPVLYEPYVRDAREYVRLAEDAHGPIDRPVDFAYIWGDALEELKRFRTELRIINLETSVTRSADRWRGKEVLYRMHPENIGCLTAAGVDCCMLANNHVLDWDHAGLLETLGTLDGAGIRHAGAGRNAEEAAAPATLAVPGKGRVLVYSFGSVTSGVLPEWGATDERAGVNLLPDLWQETAESIAGEIQGRKHEGDFAIASIHWGSNWGYAISREQVRFAHLLIEGGVDLVHGHSSHHVKGFEVYRDHLILYGCGDFLNDYEGIAGNESYRDDLTLMYLVTVDPGSGGLVEARLVPMRIQRFTLNRVRLDDAKWLAGVLNREGKRFGAGVELREDRTMTVRWS